MNSVSQEKSFCSFLLDLVKRFWLPLLISLIIHVILLMNFEVI